jgi:NADH-quinone oxidoreductase subunit J
MWIDILLTILTVVFSLLVVFSKKTVVAAFALLMTLVTIGMIYFQLGTVFLAAIQVLVNAGAIAILFVFVMMLINLEQFHDNREKGKLKLVISSLTLLIVLGVLALIFNNNIEMLTAVNITDNSMKVLFAKLFDVYYLPFELATVLLLAALVACVVITAEERKTSSEYGEKND